jgi:hypothetical protein
MAARAKRWRAVKIEKFGEKVRPNILILFLWHSDCLVFSAVQRIYSRFAFSLSYAGSFPSLLLAHTSSSHALPPPLTVAPFSPLLPLLTFAPFAHLCSLCSPLLPLLAFAHLSLLPLLAHLYSLLHIALRPTPFKGNTLTYVDPVVASAAGLPLVGREGMTADEMSPAGVVIGRRGSIAVADPSLAALGPRLMPHQSHQSQRLERKDSIT